MPGQRTWNMSQRHELPPVLPLGLPERLIKPPAVGESHPMQPCSPAKCTASLALMPEGPSGPWYSEASGGEASWIRRTMGNLQWQVPYMRPRMIHCQIHAGSAYGVINGCMHLELN